MRLLCFHIFLKVSLATADTSVVLPVPSRLTVSFFPFPLSSLGAQLTLPPTDRKKRKFELGRQPANTRLGTKRVRTVRVRGGNLKHRALRLETGNFAWATEHSTRKTRIIGVVYNSSNNELVRTNTLVKGAIVQVDATPFRQWYESHYHVPVTRKGRVRSVLPTRKAVPSDVHCSSPLLRRPRRRPSCPTTLLGSTRSARRTPRSTLSSRHSSRLVVSTPPSPLDPANPAAPTGTSWRVRSWPSTSARYVLPFSPYPPSVARDADDNVSLSLFVAESGQGQACAIDGWRPGYYSFLPQPPVLQLHCMPTTPRYRMLNFRDPWDCAS
jgi:ribosomal protein eS8